MEGASIEEMKCVKAKSEEGMESVKAESAGEGEGEGEEDGLEKALAADRKSELRALDFRCGISEYLVFGWVLIEIYPATLSFSILYIYIIFKMYIYFWVKRAFCPHFCSKCRLNP